MRFNTNGTRRESSIMLKNILNFLDYVLFLGMMYILYLGLKHADQINQLIIELKGGAI